MRRSSELRQRLGWTAVEAERTLWLIGDSMPAFEAMAAMVEGVSERYRRLRILLSAPDPALRMALAHRFPQCRVLPLPFDNALCVSLFLQRCNVRVALFVEPCGEMPRALVAGLERRAVSIVAVTARDTIPLAPGPRLAASCTAFIEISGTLSEAEPGNANRQWMLRKDAIDLIGVMLARDLKPLRLRAGARRGLGALLLALARHPRLHRLSDWRIRRYASIAELRQALGAPETILCLGNGPSSEDPVLLGCAYDTLFRVNHSWLRRGRFSHPDVVFTGGKPTMRALRTPIFGLQTPAAEERFALLKIFAPTASLARFFNANEITDALRAFPWGGLRPTNGASMLAVAVALQPARLIVAGIDLFQHHDGTYPGDTVTPNDYSPGHSRDTELAFILDLFAGYRGELVIIGDVLNSEWKRYREEVARRPDDPRSGTTDRHGRT